MRIQAMITILLTAALACVDETAPADTDEFDDSETGEACLAEAPADCDATGRCWTTRPGWGADAQTLTMAEIDGAVEMEILTADPDLPSCWIYGSPDDVARTCVVELVEECVILYARPVWEIEFADGSCDLAGPWSSTATDVYGACWGVLDEWLAVRLR